MIKEEAKKLLTLYQDGQLPDYLYEVIQGWLVNGDDEEQKQEILLEMISQQKFFRKPTKKDYRNLRKLQRILQFDKHKMIVVPFFKRTAVRVAAVMLPVFILAGAYFITERPINSDPHYVAEATISVADGDHDSLILPDGSKIWINEASELSYSENFLHNREVYLTGEAYFSVTNMDNQTPFIVKTDAFIVKVLGTEFNVKAYANDAIAEVTLTRGSVEVVTGDETVRLEPSLQAVIDRLTATMHTRRVSPEQIQWTPGGKVFENVDMREIFKYLAGHYKVIFAVEDDLPLDKTLRIRLKGNETLYDALYALKSLSNLKFEYKIEGDTVYIMSLR